jgi:hypothetical protein
MWWFRDKHHVVYTLLFAGTALFAAAGRRLSAVLIVGMMLVYFVVELGWGGGTKHDWSHRPNMKQIHRRKRSGRPG